jgi:hypothetical protein
MLLKFILDQSLFLIGLYIFVTLFAATEIGYRLGSRFTRDKDSGMSERQEKGIGIITSAMLALVAFVMAISISMADSRFDTRRKVILEEANAISTSYLRAQQVRGIQGEAIMKLLQEYARLRIDFIAAGEDQERLKKIDEETALLQQRIWDYASAAAVQTPTPIIALLLGSLNQMFDLATTQRWAFQVRVPFNVIRFLHFVSLLTMGVLGYFFSLNQYRHLILTSLLLFALTASMLLIIDLDKPRGGNIQAEQSPLIWSLESMKGKAQ